MAQPGTAQGFLSGAHKNPYLPRAAPARAQELAGRPRPSPGISPGKVEPCPRAPAAAEVSRGTGCAGALVTVGMASPGSGGIPPGADAGREGSGLSSRRSMASRFSTLYKIDFFFYFLC